MSIPILFQPLELFFVDDIDLAKGKEAGSNGDRREFHAATAFRAVHP
jgi:hypothetical protein